MTRFVALFFCLVALPPSATSIAAQAPAQPEAAQPAAAQPKKLTVEAIYANGGLPGDPPDGLAWSPDGKHLTYEADGELIDVDPATSKAYVLVSRAKLAAMGGGSDSETDRDHRSRYGMASYLWAPDSAHLLFNANGSLWLYDLHNGTGVQIATTGSASGDNPKFSPNGEYLSYVRDHGLTVVWLKTANTATVVVAPAPRQDNSNTGEPHSYVTNGEVDWVYEEELAVRSNYFWSPDSRHIAYLQMNETEVPQYPIADWVPTHAQVNWQRYPQPGDPNPSVRVGVTGINGGKTTWVKLPIHDGEDYIPRFGWVDHKTLWIEVLTRDHKHRDIYFADAGSGQAHAVLQLTDEKFFDEVYGVSVGEGSILLTDWRDGHSHLYLYSYDKGNTATTTAKLERQLTKGDFEVGDVFRVDSKQRIVDYASSEGNPLERQLWQVTFDGQRTQLTTGAGNHSGSFPPAGTAFADKFSTHMEPASLRFCAAPGHCKTFWESHAIDAWQLRAPRQLEVKAQDGTMLYATLLLPEGATDPASVPLIVNPYGGPGSQSVANEWKDSLLFDQVLSQHGFAVLHTDNRGMGSRGREFAQAAYHNLGPVQLEDQLTVMDAALRQYPQLDPKRLGWWGWSWGGTFTLYALSHSNRFRAGVAVAPVTDWRNYDSIYTERYMSLPSEFTSGYKDFSVVNTAASLKGHLLLVHGTGDDNVHMENTVQYIQKLIDAQIPYDLQLYPRKTHSIKGADVRTHLYNRILAHFEQYLKPPVAE